MANTDGTSTDEGGRSPSEAVEAIANAERILNQDESTASSASMMSGDDD
jgi:hypothetical protein